MLVVSQFLSMELMSPKSDDPAQQQSNAILKVLPIMIGWFSLNVPSALSVYWVINNIITTTTSVLIRNSLKNESVAVVDGSSTAASVDTSIFAPPREKPAGFADFTPSVSDVKPLTAMDAEIVEKDDDEGSSAGEGMESKASSKKRGGSKKKRKKN